MTNVLTVDCSADELIVCAVFGGAYAESRSGGAQRHNGAVLGHDREYMQQHFDRIIDFAELWDFVDVPVKNYSSGMIARLGFSIATEVEAEILACDEILAVGDFMFQQKCHQRMAQMLSGGTTLLFVSHDINQVKQLCKRAIWIDHGRVRGDGPAGEVCDAYVAAMQRGE